MHETPTILYEDNHLLCVVKPPGMLSQEDHTGDPDMVRWLKAYLKHTYNKPGRVYLGLLHRLDRPVGGTMVFAKTSKAASRLSQALRKREWKKQYFAIVCGQPTQISAKLHHFLTKEHETNTVRTTDGNDPKGKEAILSYQRLASKDRYALLLIEPITGRAHQIRVQMANSQMALLDDAKYGEGQRHASPALWCHSIVFVHPVKREPMTVSSFPNAKYPWTLFADYFGKTEEPV